MTRLWGDTGDGAGKYLSLNNAFLGGTANRIANIYVTNGFYVRGAGLLNYEAGQGTSNSPAHVFRNYTNSGSLAYPNQPFMQLLNTFSPASGTANYSHLHLKPTIDQQGGANGTTWGLFIEPALTNAEDWRSIEFSNDTGWGIYGEGDADNYLSGRLGIGTTTPAKKLDVVGDVRIGDATSTTSLLNIEGNATGVNFIGQQYLASGTTKFRTGYVNDGFEIKPADGGGSFSLPTALHVNRPDGNVGIGTASPTANLHVNGNAKIATISNATTDTDKFLVDDTDEIKYRTGPELRSDLDIFGQTATVTVTALTAADTIVDFSGTATANHSAIFTRADQVVDMTVSFEVWAASGTIGNTFDIDPPASLDSDFTLVDLDVQGHGRIQRMLAASTPAQLSIVKNVVADTANDNIEVSVNYGKPGGAGAYPDNRFKVTATFKYLLK